MEEIRRRVAENPVKPEISPSGQPALPWQPMALMFLDDLGATMSTEEFAIFTAPGPFIDE